MWNIEDHRRHTYSRKRKVDEKKDERRTDPRPRPTPNFKERTVIQCDMLYEKPCRCRRLIGVCVKCRREVVVTAGERATPLLQHEKGRLIGYTCNRCR